MKKCSKCQQFKELSLFYKNKKLKDGLCCSCKLCHLFNSDKARHNETSRKSRKTYYNNNKEQIIKKFYERLDNDILFKLKHNLRSRLTTFLKTNKGLQKSSFGDYIGCTQVELKAHLEKQFKPEMSWDNYGKWHIDHIIPLSLAKTEIELHKLCNYNNLQPLWAAENIKKGNRPN